MSFRFGHQITCNIKRNTFFRSLSADSSNRGKAFTTIAFKQILNGNRMPLGKYINVVRTRSLPSPENNCRKYSSRKPPDEESDESMYISEESQNFTYVKPVMVILAQKKISTTPLQSPQLSPVINSVSRNPSLVPEAVRSVQIDSLRRVANAQYEEAVKLRSNQEVEETYRYQLEAATPKTEIDDRTYSVHQKYMKKQIDAENMPLLQPKNLKPYGKIPEIPWIAPKVEYRKKNLFQKYKKGDNETNCESETLSNHSQYRKYSTVNTTPPEKQTQLEKCRTIIYEYKKINPEYSEKHINIKPGSIEERKFVKDTENIVSEIKRNYQIYTIGTKTQTQVDRQLQHKLENFSSQYQPRLNQSPTKSEKIKLYYDIQHGNKVLSFKLLQDKKDAPAPDSLGNSWSDVNKEEEIKPIKIKIGPKLMLQSSSMQNFNQQLTPAVNEKFITPWLSWSDRVKINAVRARKKDALKVETYSTPNLSVKKSNSVLGIVETRDSLINNKFDVQRRDYSFIVNEECCNTKNYNWTDALNRSMNVDEMFSKKNLDKKQVNRLFSTNSTHGVFGPEGTVMVRLRRLPKINIAESPRICPEEEKCEVRQLRKEYVVKPEKLPKLVPSKAPIVSRVELKDIPLSPLKYRNVKVKERAPPKCAEPICIMKRADDDLKEIPKKLPKIILRDCSHCTTRVMTSPSLARLKPKKIVIEEPPKVCPVVLKDICVPRADEGLTVTRKKLPPLKMLNYSPIYERQLTDGPPLKRLKKKKYPADAKRSYEKCYEEVCPPRADEIYGYKVKRKKLKTLIFSEKYNNISWREFSREPNLSRHYTTQSKCDICCYSDKKVRPDMKVKSEVIPSELDKFEGILHSGEDGKMQTYLPVTEVTDISTGSELKILRKPIGSRYRKTKNVHEELLKGGFTTYMDENREFSSVTHTLSKKSTSCDIPPEKLELKDLEIRPMKKRKGYQDYPARWTVNAPPEDKVYFDPCAETPRSDNLMNYTVTSKPLPPLPKGKCKCPEKAKPKTASPKLKRLKKSRIKCEKCVYIAVCEPVCEGRADETWVEKTKKLPPMVISKCPKPPVPPADNVKFRRLPRIKVEEPPKCKPMRCDLPDPPHRADSDKDLYHSKTMPAWKPGNCPCTKPPSKSARPLTRLLMPRLPAPPFLDREDNCQHPCVDRTLLRSDVINKYEVKKKKLPVILRSSNKPLSKSFCTLSDNFKYENYSHQTSARGISSTSYLLGSQSKKKKATTRKAAKFKLQYCKPVSKDTSCRKLRPTCLRTKSPYPSFSECKDYTKLDVLGECTDDVKHLQPRHPILSEIVNLQPPPPHQGKIDPSLEEDCIAKKLNIVLEGGTKTCETINEPDKPRLTKEMFNEIMENPPYKEYECANENSCKPCQNLSVCLPPPLECKLPPAHRESMLCTKSEDSGSAAVASDKCKTSKQNLTSEKSVPEDKLCQVVNIDCSEMKTENIVQSHNAIPRKKKKVRAKRSSNVVIDDCENTKNTKKSPVVDPCLKTFKTRKSVNKRASCRVIGLKSPPKSFIDKILDFFSAKPNCPAPNQWKKDRLKRKAEQAAAAAGYELSEKQKAKVLKVTCKNVGVKDSCMSQNKQSSKCMSTKASKNDSGNKKCKAVQSPAKKKCSPLPQQEGCASRARFNCKESGMIRPSCTPVISPYPSYSECQKNFKKLPTSECNEQKKRQSQRTISFDTLLDNKKYCTSTSQSRCYSNKTGRIEQFLSFLSLSTEIRKELESNEFARKNLIAIENNMMSIPSAGQSNGQETYQDAYKELVILFEEELKKNLQNEQLNYSPSLLGICSENAWQNTLFDLGKPRMEELIKQICRISYSMPNLSTKSYEESEQIKTENLRKELEEINKKYS